MNALRIRRMSEAVGLLDPQLIMDDPPQNSLDNPSEMMKFLRDQCDKRSAQIRKWEEEITKFQSIRNLFYPAASYLPPETLTTILDLLYDSSPEPHRNRDFLSALLTCKQWHEVALNVSRFWGTIRINNTIAIETCLERCGVAPLSLYLENAPLGDPVEVVDKLTPQVHRVRSFVAEHEDPDALVYLVNRLAMPAPNLEVLRVACLKEDHWNLNINPFGHHMHSLRTLDLTRAWLPAVTSWTRNLHNLSLRSIICTLSEIRDILRMCSSLQVLTLEDLEKWADDSDTFTVPVEGVLPNLQQLNVQCTPIQDAEIFLFNFCLPRSAKLRLAMDVYEERASGGPNDWCSIPNFIASPTTPACVCGLKRFEIIWDENARAAILRGYRNAGNYVAPDLEIEFANANSLHVIPAPEHWPFEVRGVEALVLQMGSGDDVQYDRWDILQDFRNVKSFRLTGADARSVMSLLGALSDTGKTLTTSDGREATPWKLCYRLRTLELFDFECPPTFYEGLKVMIRTRKDKGSVLGSVSVKGPGVRDMHITWSGKDSPFAITKPPADA